MDLLSMVEGIDTRLGDALHQKPYWKITKSNNFGLDSMALSQGTNSFKLVAAILDRLQNPRAHSIKTELVQTVSCCTSLKLSTLDDLGMVVSFLILHISKNPR